MLANWDFSRNVDNDLAFFSVKTDSSMDMSHLIRYTKDKITNGSEITLTLRYHTVCWIGPYMYTYLSEERTVHHRQLYVEVALFIPIVKRRN